MWRFPSQMGMQNTPTASLRRVKTLTFANECHRYMTLNNLKMKLQ